MFYSHIKISNSPILEKAIDFSSKDFAKTSLIYSTTFRNQIYRQHGTALKIDILELEHEMGKLYFCGIRFNTASDKEAETADYIYNHLPETWDNISILALKDFISIN